MFLLHKFKSSKVLVQFNNLFLILFLLFILVTTCSIFVFNIVCIDVFIICMIEFVVIALVFCIWSFNFLFLTFKITANAGNI